MRVKIFILLSICCSFIGTAYVYASDDEPDKFRIALGGYFITSFDSIVSLQEPNLGAGISLSPEDTLGMDHRQTVIRLDGYYRFNKAHALSYSWYSLSSTGSKVADTQISWIDRNGDEITIPVGAQVDSVFDYDIFKVGYLYSFYHSEKVELVVGAGLHVTRLELGLTAETTSSGIDASDVDVTAPLPVISLGLKYNVTPKFSWHIKSEVFAISYDEYDGTYTDATLGMEYRAWTNIGLGIGLGSNALDLNQTTSDYKLKYSNRLTGIHAYLAAYF